MRRGYANEMACLALKTYKILTRRLALSKTPQDIVAQSFGSLCERSAFHCPDRGIFFRRHPLSARLREAEVALTCPCSTTFCWLPCALCCLAICSTRC